MSRVSGVVGGAAATFDGILSSLAAWLREAVKGVKGSGPLTRLRARWLFIAGLFVKLAT
jgi:hypothetical protein